MKNERNRCQNCKFREDYGGGDSYCRKTGFGYRAEKYDCENFVDREKQVRESMEVTYQVNIPKDATNGDVIKAMFPKIEMFVGGNVVETNYHAHGDIWFCTAYDKEWWNAKYKKER